MKEKEKNTIKITCPKCKRTSNEYPLETKYCMFCGTNLENYIKNHSK